MNCKMYIKYALSNDTWFLSATLIKRRQVTDKQIYKNNIFKIIKAQQDFNLFYN